MTESGTGPHARDAGGLTLPRLGFGAAVFGGAYGAMDEGDGQRLVDAAIDAGVTFFDTSPYYGLTTSESVLGRLLVGRRLRVMLGTKAGRNGRDDFDFSAAGITRSIQASLRRLQTEYVDLLIAHDIEYGDPAQVLDETYGVLVRLKEAGLCRAIGMSGYPLPIFGRVVSECRLDVVLSYCHGTLWDTRVTTQLAPVAEARGTALINASPLGMGLLTEAGPPGWHPATPEIKAACHAAAVACRDAGGAISDIALRHSVRLQGIDCTLVGMRTLDELAANLAALEHPPAPVAYAAALAALEPVRDHGWTVGKGMWPEARERE